MKVLGISDNHCSGAALVEDGKLTAAVNQERLDRIKNSGVFPWDAVDAVLAMRGLKPSDINLIAVASEITPSFPLRLLGRFHRKIRSAVSQFSYIYNSYIFYQVVARKLWPIYALDAWACRKLMEKRFAERGFSCSVKLVEHHECHAAASHLTSPFDRATIITADAMGDAISLTVSIGEPDGAIRRIFAQSGYASINPYYTRITELLGFVPNRHEGKVTGLAAYGDPFPLIELFNRICHFVGPGFSKWSLLKPSSLKIGTYHFLKKQAKQNVAAACQQNLENEISKFVRYHLSATKIPYLVLGGGIFENVKVNGTLARLPEVQGLYIFPNMSDGGIAVGAALIEGRGIKQPLATPFLGPSYSRVEIEKAIAGSDLPVRQMTDPADEIGNLLAMGHVVCRFSGSLEYGPRALGHRSILYRPDDPSVIDWLNRTLDRSGFMPFAPVVSAEKTSDLFQNFSKVSFTGRFMNVALPATEYMAERCGGVVHVDKTARPQFVTPGDDTGLSEILSAYEKRTGLCALLNTSFNMHEEPIVSSPADAVRAYLASGLDYLVLDDLLAGPRKKQ